MKSVHDIGGNFVLDVHNLVNYVINGGYSFVDRVRHVFNGICIGIVKSTNVAGDIKVKVASTGFQQVEIVITSKEHQI